jgi:hypothetical protein
LVIVGGELLLLISGMSFAANWCLAHLFHVGIPNLQWFHGFIGFVIHDGVLVKTVVEGSEFDFKVTCCVSHLNSGTRRSAATETAA